MMNTQFEWLAGTYWYVPDEYLKAIQLDTQSGAVSNTIDQTVWHFSKCEDGYVWGNAYVMLKAENQSTRYLPIMYVAGSIMPEGNVQLTFVEVGSKAASPTSTSGFGTLVQENGKWVFKMQMTSGVTYLAVHWAQMWQTREGDPSWDDLPGTDGESVAEFLDNF